MDSPVIDLTCCPAGRRSPFKRSSSKFLHNRRRSSSRSRQDGSASRSQQGDSSSISMHVSEMPSAVVPSQSAGLSRPDHRFAGDGLDFRRPAIPFASLEPSNVVDLTGSDDESNDNDDIQITSINETSTNTNTNPARSSGASGGWNAPTSPPQSRITRGPRYAQRIIHDEDDIPVPNTLRSDQRSSARLQNLSSRTLPPLQMHSEPNAAMPRPEIIEIADDADDAGEDDIFHPQVTTQVMRNHHSGRNILENVRQGHVSHAIAVYRAMQAHMPATLQNMVAPLMDYTRTAFNMTYPAAAAYQNAPPPRPASPPYEDLVPVPDGFTRSPRDGDALICPMCKGELCVGDGEARSQVWVVKTCGHAYCGECALSRAKSKPSKKGKPSQANERKFTNCVVPNCNERLTGAKSMYQLFL